MIIFFHNLVVCSMHVFRCYSTWNITEISPKTTSTLSCLSCMNQRQIVDRKTMTSVGLPITSIEYNNDRIGLLQVCEEKPSGWNLCAFEDIEKVFKYHLKSLSFYLLSVCTLWIQFNLDI